MHCESHNDDRSSRSKQRKCQYNQLEWIRLRSFCLYGCGDERPNDYDLYSSNRSRRNGNHNYRHKLQLYSRRQRCSYQHQQSSSQPVLVYINIYQRALEHRFRASLCRHRFWKGNQFRGFFRGPKPLYGL